jgi:hypothetical protein
MEITHHAPIMNNMPFSVFPAGDITETYVNMHAPYAGA